MTRPNLISPWYNYDNHNERLIAIYGKTNYHQCLSGWTLLLENPQGSDAVYKVNSLAVMFVAENFSWGKVNNSEIHVFTGSSSPDGGTGYLYDRLQPESFSHRWDAFDETFETQNEKRYLPLTEANASMRWKVISKDEMFYLQEGERVYIFNDLYTRPTSEIATKCSAIISYEEIIGKIAS